MSVAPSVAPDVAFDSLEQDPNAVLVDVRTPAEWAFVGAPDLERIGKPLVRIPWQDMSGNQNPAFLDELREAGVSTEQPVMFLCRTGGRSQAAADAAQAAGFDHAVNVDEGFEGPPDADGHRGTVSGWKARGLPWRQP